MNNIINGEVILLGVIVCPQLRVVEFGTLFTDLYIILTNYISPLLLFPVSE